MRSLLFVPADSPRKLEKSMQSGADGIILDLEDSVAPERKADARAAAAAFLRETRPLSARPRLIVRVNALASGLIDHDLEAVIAAQPDIILLPKAEGGASVIHADAKIAVHEAVSGLPEGQTRIIALAIETAASLFLAGTFTAASRRLVGLSWGAEDLAVDLGAETSRDASGGYTDVFRLARSLCLAGAAAADVAAYDTVNVDFRNLDAFHDFAQAARRDGFSGMLAIHPAQVPVINEVFTPSAEAVASARAIIAAFDAAPAAGVVSIDGVMYDQPHLKRAQRLLARAGLIGKVRPN